MTSDNDRDPIPLRWAPGTKKAMAAMPEDVQDVFGRLLLDAQYGDHPDGARPFGEGLPSDIMKLVDDEDGETYRAAYVVAFRGVVYILDVFQKKSKSGRETPREDLERIKRRYKAAKQHFDENPPASREKHDEREAPVQKVP